MLEIEEDIRKTISEFCEEKFWINTYGSYEINPKRLIFLICIKKDETKKFLYTNNELRKRIKEIFIKHNYPENARDSVLIAYESQETVDRESDGNWHLHLK